MRRPRRPSALLRRHVLIVYARQKATRSFSLAQPCTPAATQGGYHSHRNDSAPGLWTSGQLPQYSSPHLQRYNLVVGGLEPPRARALQQVQTLTHS